MSRAALAEGSFVHARNRATVEEIAAHLALCDVQFVPPLSHRVDIRDYAAKLGNHAQRFEAWAGDRLVGLVAAYCNDRAARAAYITSVSVLADWGNRGIATQLLHRCLEYATLENLRQVRLEVATEHRAAVRLYEKCGFGAVTAAPSAASGAFTHMSIDLRGCET
jgi:ribosomal protein S18 acetylase RimI-like enzyme